MAIDAKNALEYVKAGRVSQSVFRAYVTAKVSQKYGFNAFDCDPWVVDVLRSL